LAQLLLHVHHVVVENTSPRDEEGRRGRALIQPAGPHPIPMRPAAARDAEENIDIHFFFLERGDGTAQGQQGAEVYGTGM